ARYGQEFAEKLCAANNFPPAVSIAVNTLKTTADKLKDELDSEGIKVSKGILEDILIISKTDDISRTKAFRNGHFHVMDTASAAAVCALSPSPGEKILDICAAPGGKSLLSAYKMQNKGHILSCDISETKLSLLKSSAKRLGAEIIDVCARDALIPAENERESYDRVLADLPCSGLGLLRKKPDIRLKKTAEDIPALAKLQRDILAVAQSYVRPGGELIYSTCTLSSLENELNVVWFLENFDFEEISLRSRLPESFFNKDRPECMHGIELFPHLDGTDGFYIAAFRKKDSAKRGCSNE
ncbi:MAG: methyltransferase domain-containing protein, partial [Firmicutes bacterium]|nr:methyltransferase domain-containing protein [Bacillota bacterium]